MLLLVPFSNSVGLMLTESYGHAYRTMEAAPLSAISIIVEFFRTPSKCFHFCFLL